MPIELKSHIDANEPLEHPDKVFVFGDNEVRMGRGGTARYGRGRPNCIGVRTKIYPGRTIECYWFDKDWKRTWKLLDEDFIRIERELGKGKTVVFPLGHLGSDLSKLPKFAPKTFRYLTSSLQALVNMYGLTRTNLFLPEGITYNDVGGTKG